MEEERISSSYGHRVDKLFNLSIRNVWSQIIIFFLISFPGVDFYFHVIVVREDA